MRRCAECNSARNVRDGLCESCLRARGLADVRANEDGPSLARAVVEGEECPKCCRLVHPSSLAMTLSGFALCRECRQQHLRLSADQYRGKLAATRILAARVVEALEAGHVATALMHLETARVLCEELCAHHTEETRCS